MPRNKLIEINKSKCVGYLFHAMVAFKAKASTTWCFRNKLRLLSQSLKNFQKLAAFAGLSIAQLTLGLQVDAADSKLSSKIFLDTNRDGIPDLVDSSQQSNLLFLHQSKSNYGKNPNFLKKPLANPGFDADLVGALDLYPSWHWNVDKDLVALKKATGEYATFKNNGSNSFDPKFSHLHSGNLNVPINDAVIGDLDGDGKDDLVYASPGSIGWLKNDGGSNGFLPQGEVIGGLSNEVSSLDLVDYDQDGDKEIKYRQGNVSGLSENRGSEGFSPVASYDSAEDFHFHQDDLNNDGRPDSMTVRSDGQVGYSLGGSSSDSTGTDWLGSAPLTDSSNKWRTSSLLGPVYDIDPQSDDQGWLYSPRLGWLYAEGDGDSSTWIYDAVNGWVWTNQSTFPWIWNYNTNAGENLIESATNGTLKETGFNVSVPIEAYNSAKSYSSGSIALFGQSSYVAKQNVPEGVNPSDSDYWTDLSDAAASLSKPVEEVPTLSTADILAEIRRQQGLHAFSINTRVDSSFLHDLDGNGYKDLIYLTPDNKIGWAKNDGSDGFIVQPMLQEGLPPLEDLSFHDVDYDGDKDVYVADSGSGLGILKNNLLGKIYDNQNQKFSVIRIDSENSTDFASSSAIDANHDGKKDLVYPIQGGVGWAKSMGSEGFLAQTGEALAFSPDSLASLDFDFDGDDDLIALNSSTGKYSVLSNWSRGSDGFDVTLQGDLSSAAKNAVLEDLDMDGHQDLVFSDDSDVIWGKSDGSNGFLPQLPIAQGLGKLKFLEAGDYDADGDPDFFYAQQDQATVKIGIIKNNGAGGFSVQYLNVSTTSSVDDLKLADMDGDGDQDLVLASSQSSALSLLSNQGSDGFSTDTLLATGISKVDQIKIADLDLDDDLDIIAVSSENDDGFWIRNSTDGFIPFQLG